MKSVMILSLMLLLSNGLTQAFAAPSSHREYQKAEKLFASGQFQEAILLYQGLLPSLPADVTAGAVHTRIADSYFGMGSYVKALESYRKAIREQAPAEQAATQYWIGFCCFVLGRHSEAVSEFLKIPEQHPASGMWVGTAYYWAGRVSERMGKQAEAAAYYRKAGGNGRSMQGKHALKRAEAAKETSANPK